jgi:hypothetical protein
MGLEKEAVEGGGGKGEVDSFALFEQGMSIGLMTPNGKGLVVNQIGEAFLGARQIGLFPAERMEGPVEEALGLKNGDFTAVE